MSTVRGLKTATQCSNAGGKTENQDQSFELAFFTDVF